MDLNNPVIKLCMAGSEAEFAGQIDDAKAFYRQAWDAATDDYEACIAAHYMARRQPPEEAFCWNQIALDRADAANDERVQSFYGSLYLNMGHSYAPFQIRLALLLTLLEHGSFPRVAGQ